jgi:hypothetical protein
MSDDDTGSLMDNIAKLSAEVPAEEWKALSRARMREQMAKDPKRVSQMLDDLFSSAKLQGHLDTKTDAVVADLLSNIEEALDLDVNSSIVTLIQNAAERLRRAGGGKTYDHKMGELEDRIVALTLAIATARNSFLDLEERLEPDAGENCGCRRPTYTCRYCTAKEAAEKLQEVLDGK